MPDIKTFERDTDGKLPAYAWPGGYPIYYITKDMGTLCVPCANGENGSRAADKDLDTDCPDDAQWIIVAGEVNYEDPHLACDHCNAAIEAAYTDSEEVNEDEPETKTHYRLSFSPYSGVGGIPKEFEDEDDARNAAAKRIRRARKNGYPVEIIEKGKTWEIEEPEDSVMQGDESGTLTISTFTKTV